MRPKKSLGQNFLKDEIILTKIVENGNISENDIVIEIGPGTGNLTEKILDKNPKHFIVVEKDKELSSILKKKFDNKIQIINKDILDCYNSFFFREPVKIFGNLPYNISTKILTSFIKIDDLKSRIKKLIFLFQKEVADRIIAEENSKKYGRLSILTSWKMHSLKIADINPNCFYPKPKIWSSLIILTPKNNYKSLKNIENLEHITNIFFNQRRKMIKKPMRQLFNDYEEIAQKLEIDLNLRPQNITMKKYLEICKIYESLT